MNGLGHFFVDSFSQPGSVVGMVLGAGLIVVGLVVLYNAKLRPAERHGRLRGVGIGLLGCGAFLVLTPVLMVLSVLLVGAGVIAFCQTSTAC